MYYFQHIADYYALIDLDRAALYDAVSCPHLATDPDVWQIYINTKKLT